MYIYVYICIYIYIYIYRDDEFTAQAYADVGCACDVSIRAGAEEAVLMLTHAVSLQRRVWGDDHFSTALFHENLSKAQATAARFQRPGVS